MDTKKIMKIVVIVAVICIPLMYSFFYLKSYWDPYGRLENMTVAMVNLDEGDEEGNNLGQDFVDGLIEKDVVKIKQVTEEEAQRGLEEEDYFAVITVPKTFTKYLNSAAEKDKHVATITYSPNQKMNYLASQIISRVVLAAETELQSQVSEKVVETLANNLKEVPQSMEKISDGADRLLEGATELSNGLSQINTGVATLNSSYADFDAGVNNAYTGSQALTNGIAQVNSGAGQLGSGTTELDSGIAQISAGTNTLATQAGAGITDLTNGISQLDAGVASLNAGTTALVAGTASDSQLASGASAVAGGAAAVSSGISALNAKAQELNAGVSGYVSSVNSLLPAITALETAGQVPAGTSAGLQAAGAQLTGGTGALVQGTSAGSTLAVGAAGVASGAAQVSSGITTLNQKAQELNAGAGQIKAGTSKLASAETTNSLNKLVSGIGTLQNALAQVQAGSGKLKSGAQTLSSGTNQLQNGSQTLTNGLGTLSSASGQVKNALGTLGSGTQSAFEGSVALKDGINELKTGVTEGIEEANQELTKLDGLSDFVRDSVEIEEVDYGEVSAYGTAFTPLFISVALWVGALMSYVVFYYDQNKRFKLLGNFAENKYLQNALYLAFGAVQGLVTGFVLNLGLDMDIQNYALYYGSCMLIAVTFMGIIQFFIRNFGEVGKFLALLVLVLQLAASGGTFPVQLIDEGFQKISAFLPMTYTIKLTKESVIMQRDGVAGHNIGIILGYAIVCIGITYGVEFIKSYRKKNDLKEAKQS